MSDVSVAQAHLSDIARRGLPVPLYDRSRLVPRIVHVGVGGFHRAHLAVYVHELAAAGSDWAIAGLGLLDADAAMRDALAPQDELYTLIEKGAGEPTAEVIGSIVRYVHAPPDDGHAVADLIAAPATAILSLTVTEGGYAEPQELPGTFDRLAAGLARRRALALGPVTVLSCDNLPGNGDAARAAMVNAAARIDDRLATWVGEQCTFPNSMVDRITPQTQDADRRWLRERLGVDDRWPVVCEPFRQWVIDGEFAAGRPPWEDAGVLFTDRIHDWERYKLRFLNAGHSSIAYLSALAGVELVHEALAVPEIRAFLEELLYREALPTVPEIPGHPRERYVESVLERFANPGVGDQIARLCIDGSAKFRTFLVPTISRQLELGGPIDCATTALAAWARYLGTSPEIAFDASGEEARRYGALAVDDPLAFLAFDPMSELRDSERFRTAFDAAYRKLAADGPLAALTLARAGEPR
ncbi:mannitol dehydrogenase family protein [Solirubrobacter soli]|uniref:mannitol dehydrogenase family protein n=1 Tax=Solirubrobacter soli TaxID=363832 RepID=UPI00041E5E62|nr:mannitol dehydrogenase family protein [Solirubrobacter soli]